jgi:hypothetical protein
VTGSDDLIPPAPFEVLGEVARYRKVEADNVTARMRLAAWERRAAETGKWMLDAEAGLVDRFGPEVGRVLTRMLSGGWSGTDREAVLMAQRLVEEARS